MPSPDDLLIEQLARFERAGDLAPAFRLLAARPQTPQALAAIAFGLYRRDLSALAFILVQNILAAGIENAMLHALGAHLALRLEQPEPAAKSIARLTQLIAGASAAEREAARSLLDPFLPRDAIVAFHHGNHALNSAYIRLWGAIDPALRARLARPAADRASDLARFLRPASDESKLLRYASPPAGAPRVPRKAVLGIRHLWVPEQPTSREHDIPARYAAAFEAYGWQVLRHDLSSFQNQATVAADYQALATLCRDNAADLLVLDDFEARRGADAAGAILRALKRELPALRVVGIYMDPWLPENWGAIEAGADCLDAVWSPVATPVWQRAAFSGKTLFLPFPHGGSFPAAAARIEPRLRFGGGVQYSNWDRAFWLAAIADAGLPLTIAASHHQHDKRDALESYRGYMLQSATGEAALNFARRSNGISTVTGRTFETLATGTLLVQERSDDVDLFFVANRHYLRFETMADLFDVADLLAREPGIAETIRRDGAAFFAGRYGDEQLVGYLDQLIFHRDSASRAAA